MVVANILCSEDISLTLEIMIMGRDRFATITGESSFRRTTQRDKSKNQGR